MKTTRREMLEQTGLIALGTLLPGCHSTRYSSVAPASKDAPMPAQYAPKPLPFDPAKLPGLSEQLLRSHHENNYIGAVKKLNGVRERLAGLDSDTAGYELHGLAQGELAFKHSVVLHELYFGNLVGGGSTGTATIALLNEHFKEHFGGAGWEQRFRALANSLAGGSGWAILEFDLHEKVPRMYSAADHTQGLSSGVPLLVLDMYEHSYHMDYGTAAANYIDAVFANLHWEEIDRRTKVALDLAERIG